MEGLHFQVRSSTSITSVHSVGHIDVADEMQELAMPNQRANLATAYFCKTPGLSSPSAEGNREFFINFVG